MLLQDYSVLQSTTPVLLCTTQYYSRTTPYYKYYSNTTLHYKVLLHYYSILQSATTCYKVLIQCYFVLQSTTPVLLSTTKSALVRSSPVKNAHFTKVSSVRHERPDERVARPAQDFYQSFERPTRTKSRNGCRATEQIWIFTTQF